MGKSAELSKLSGTTMAGKSELWLDPLGNEPLHCDCELTITGGVVSYSWSFKDKPQQGRIELRDGGASWSDSWHQPEAMSCEDVPGSWALFDVAGTYGAGEGPDWGWRASLVQRPSGELVLQMDNIAPWGERARAVRMVLSKP